jgi:hypothetical protein
MEGQPLLGRRRLPSADVLITLRGRHLAVGCVLLLGMWRLQAGRAPAREQPPLPGTGFAQVTGGSPAVAPGPAATSPGGAPALAAPRHAAPTADLSAVEVSRLAAELHRRGYG